MDEFTLRGIPNLHSHAFQRAMAGLAERRLHPTDSFWTWRETMYAMALQITPDDLYAIARQLYVEMLQAGYTTVCEFHYVHHDLDGAPFTDSLAMSKALIAAAHDVGIRLTLLPVLYMTSGIDGAPLNPRQRRFGHTVDSYLRDWHALSSMQGFALGCAFHSIRAVPLHAMRSVVAALPESAPLHIHIAEQLDEVDAAKQLLGARPVQWLLGEMDVSSRWTLVHATHLDESETRALAASGATVAICPTTEANLGDGIFPAQDYMQSGGRWGIGSDSHISVSPVEELRWLEYAQRLISHRRTVLCNDDQPRNAQYLLDAVDESGGSATGYSRADLDLDTLILDCEHPIMAGSHPDDVAERWIFSGNRPIVLEVRVNGIQVIGGGQHRDSDAIASDYRRVVSRLTQS